MSFKQGNGVILQEIRASVTLRRCQGSITVRKANVNNSGAVGMDSILPMLWVILQNW